MNTKLLRYLLIAVVLQVPFKFAQAVEIVDWTNSFLFQGDGSDYNPLIRVGFNPQPEPPAHPPEPGLQDRFTPMIVAQATEGTPLRLLFGIDSGAKMVFQGLDALPQKSVFNFQILNAQDESLMFDVFFNITSASGGVPDPVSWFGFNPQPEPPALGNMAGAFGFDMKMTSYSAITLTLQMFDSKAQPIAFKQVPESSALSLFALGMLIMMIAMVRRKKISP